MAKAQKLRINDIDIEEIADTCESINKDDAAPLHIFTKQNNAIANELSSSSISPDSSRSSIEATEEIIKAVNELKRLEELKKKLFQLESNLKDKITDFMGLNQILTQGHYTLVTWKSQTSRRFDAAGFKVGYPDLYVLFQKETSIRVFRTY